MSNLFWERLNYIFGLLSIVVLFVLTAFTAHLEIKDLDLWLHIATGKFIVTNGFVPAYDVLSCTIAGKPWVNHEWLFQVLVYKIYEWGGPDHLIIMQAVVVVLNFFLLLFIGYSRDRQFAAAFLLLLILLVYQARLTIRPDIFSLLFFTIYIYIISLHIDKRWSVYALFLVQVLWSNFHGFFFLGPLIIAIAILNEFLKRRVRLPFEWNSVGRLTDEEYRRLKVIFLLVIAACLVNPLTFEGAWYPIQVMTHLSGESQVFFQTIQELQPPTSWETLFSMDEYPYYKLLILLSLYSFLFNLRTIDIGVLLFWIFFLWFSLVAKRNMVFFGYAAYFVSLSNIANTRLMHFLPLFFTSDKFRYLTAILFKIGLLAWMIHFGLSLLDHGYYDFDKFKRKSEFFGVTQRNYANKAADFLVKHQIKGNFFNDFNSGAYLVGRTFPNIKVFIDGRTEVYGPQFFNQYKKIWSDGEAGLLDQAIEKYQLTGAFMQSMGAPIPKGILKNFYKKGWVLVYLDYDGVIFLNPNVPDYKEIIAQDQIDPSQWTTKPFDLKRFGTARATPYQHLNRAQTLESLGFPDAALGELRQAEKIAPGMPEIYELLGKIYGDKKNHELAFENFRIAATFNPEDPELRVKLAMAYENLGDIKNAIKHFGRALNLAPDKTLIYFRLSRAYAKDQQFEKSINVLRAAHAMDPKDTIDLYKIGDLILEAGEYEKARAAYAMALETPKPSAATHFRIGQTYLKEGKFDLAREEFEKGLTIDPEHGETLQGLRELKERPAKK